MMHSGRTPRALLLAAVFATALAATALAQDASVVYLEGEPERRMAGGATEWLDFGTVLQSGDSVVTGRDDFVELEQGRAAAIRVEPGTVFTIREVEQNGQRETVMSNSVGSVSYRFNRLAGRSEPRVGTSTVVAGIRGTELTVYAGADGASLFLVTSGEVEVSSAGETVSLTENEGVEVPAGGPPGEKFEVIGRELDFSGWAAERQDAFLDDPVAALEGVTASLAEYADGASEWWDAFQAAKVESDAAFAQISEFEAQEDRQRHRDEVWRPLASQTGAAVLNYRYYALSALSLRRYIIGPMYVQMKSRNIINPTDTYRAFLALYQDVIAGFSDEFTRYLEETDI